MMYGQIQLGANKGSGKSLDRASSQGFFYGGVLVVNDGLAGISRNRAKNITNPARQHLILQTICRRQRYVETTELTELYGKWLRPVTPPPAPFFTIPSRKRENDVVSVPLWVDADRPTPNSSKRKELSQIIHDLVPPKICYKRYAGWGKHDSVCKSRYHVPPVMQVGKNPTHLESLSSAAEIRCSARNTRLWCIYLCLACTHS